MAARLSLARELLPPGSRVLCAVSGGADSMCLLHLLWSRREELDIRVLAAHYEHGLRGEESLRDAAFVEAWCREREIPFSLGRGDVGAYARERRLGVEEAARELRYAFLERTAGDLACDLIATAHNADDNAETLLLNLCRGSGAAGLGGIPPRRGRIVRPLLAVPRREIEAYLEENAVPHVEDSSNASDDYSRNLLRHQALPVLLRLNPAFLQAAGRTACLLRRDDECLQAQAEAFIRRCYDGESLPLAELLALPEALSSRVLRSLCPRGLDMGHVQAALAFAAGEGLGWLDLPGLRIRREQGRLYFSQAKASPLPDRALYPGEPLAIPERGLVLVSDLTRRGEEIHGLFKTYFFKSDKLCGTIACGSRHPGDRIRPAGRGCAKSLKSLFTEAGWTQTQRDRALVFRDGAGVLAVEGLAVDERVFTRPGERALKIELREEKRGFTEEKAT